MKEKEIGRAVVLNTLTQWGYQGISFIAGIFCVRILILRLGGEIYGLWTVIFSLAGYTWILEAGLSPAVSRYVSTEYLKEKKENLSKIVSTGFLTSSLTGILVLLLGTCFLPFLKKLIPSPQFSATLLFFLILLSIATSSFYSSFREVFTGLNRFYVVNGVKSLTEFIRVFLLYLLIHRGTDILKVAWIYLGLEIFQGFVFFSLLPVPVSFRFVDRDYLRKLLSFSLGAFAVVVAGRIFYSTDYIIIQYFLSPLHVTLYSLALKPVIYLSGIIGRFSSVMLPVFGGYHGIEKPEKIKDGFLRACKFTTSISFLLGIPLLVYGREIISLWVGKEYASAYPYLLIMGIPYLLYLIFHPGGALVYALNRIKFFAWMHILSAILNVSLTLAFIKYGLYGVAWGTAVPVIIFHIFILPWYYLKTLSIPLPLFFQKSLKTPLILFIPYALLLFYTPFRYSFPIYLFFLILFLKFIPDEREKSILKSFLTFSIIQKKGGEDEEGHS